MPDSAAKIHSVTLPDGHVISDDRSRIDMTFVHDRLASTYWMAGRSRAVTERSWAHCLCFGIHAPTNGQKRQMVGFGRLLTDFALRAHLGDVFIDPASRGRGLGKALIETILAHPDLTSVGNWTLSTADAHGLYARFGFRAGAADARWMVLDRATLTD